MSQRLVIDVDRERVVMDVHDEFNMNNVRALVGRMVMDTLGFDEYENEVHVCVRVERTEGNNL
jgi:hypothetical protein